jgi:hypothetical protein
MTKAQQTILQQAQKYEYTAGQVLFLSNKDLPASILKICSNYFYAQNCKNQQEDGHFFVDVTEEAQRCIDMVDALRF